MLGDFTVYTAVCIIIPISLSYRTVCCSLVSFWFQVIIILIIMLLITSLIVSPVLVPYWTHAFIFSIVDRSVYIHSYTFYSHHPSKSRAYFYCCFIAYILGLGTTITVMHVFRAAQPALLYLVPTCVGLPLLLSVVRGEIQPLLKYVNKIFIYNMTGINVY